MFNKCQFEFAFTVPSYAMFSHLSGSSVYMTFLSVKLPLGTFSAPWQQIWSLSTYTYVSANLFWERPT